MAVYKLKDSSPTIAASAYVAPNASVIGHVVLADQSSVWFGATLRGDNEIISIGRGSNVQDGTVMHTDPGFPLTVGAEVSVGHQAMLHGCTVGDGSLIGIQAVVLNAAVIGKGCLVGAGAVITERKVFADGTLILGRSGQGGARAHPRGTREPAQDCGELRRARRALPSHLPQSSC